MILLLFDLSTERPFLISPSLSFLSPQPSPYRKGPSLMSILTLTLNLLLISRIDSASGRGFFYYAAKVFWNPYLPLSAHSSLTSFRSAPKTPQNLFPPWYFALPLPLCGFRSMLFTDFPLSSRISFVSFLSWTDGCCVTWRTTLVCPDECTK